ncbi:MAG: NapC/NirT family cytochrome c [Bryobacteraceae bacterium]
MTARIREWLGPAIQLANNWISLSGVVLVTTASLLWLFLVVGSRGAAARNPYLGILEFLVLPAAFLVGLLLIPLGQWLRRKAGPFELPPLSWKSVAVRRLVWFFSITTLANVVIGSHLTYQATHYMDTPGFCGQACHQVMGPEFNAYRVSVHQHVECVHCHIGQGATSYVQAKLNGIHQVIALATTSYSRPITAREKPVPDAKETCENCHRSQRDGEKLRIITRFGDDEANSISKSVLLMKLGRIHTAHAKVSYRADDPQKITWVKSQTGVFTSAAGNTDSLPERRIQCIDCHNRIGHDFPSPADAVDRAMAAGRLPKLPFIKKRAVEMLGKDFPSPEAARQEIAKQIEAQYPAGNDRALAIREVSAIFEQNVYPALKIKWGTYPSNLGHNDSPGCFRCHDDDHKGPGGKAIGQDCNACHVLVAMQEAKPEIIEKLGLESGQ